MIMVFGIILNGREWRHALSRSLITLCCRSISGNCSEAEAMFSDTPIFSKAVLIGTNSPSMSSVDTLNPLLVYRAFTLVTHCTNWMVVRFLRVSAVVKLRCRLIDQCDISIFLGNFMCDCHIICHYWAGFCADFFPFNA